MTRNSYFTISLLWNTRLVIITCLNTPSSRWNGKWRKILELSLETQVLILFLLLFSPSFFIAWLDNFIVRKSYQSLDYINVVFATLVSMNWEGLIQQNPKKYILIEREKIRKRCKEFMKEILIFQVYPIWPGLFWSITARGRRIIPSIKNLIHLS